MPEGLDTNGRGSIFPDVSTPPWELDNPNLWDDCEYLMRMMFIFMIIEVAAWVAMMLCWLLLRVAFGVPIYFGLACKWGAGIGSGLLIVALILLEVKILFERQKQNREEAAQRESDLEQLLVPVVLPRKDGGFFTTLSGDQPDPTQTTMSSRSTRRRNSDGEEGNETWNDPYLL